MDEERIVEALKKSKPLQGERDDVVKQQIKLEKSQKLKWTLSVFCMAMRFLLDGVEYAIVLPTLYGFLIKLKANVEFIGNVVAAYAVGGLIAAPIMGKISDHFGIGKLVICFGCVLSIGGNVTYFFATDKWHLVIARFLCGMSSGVEPVILGEIGKNERVKPSRRASLFSMLFTIRQAGMLLGPAVVIIFTNIHIEIGAFTIDKSNLGGLFSAVLFMICLACFILFFDVMGVSPPDSQVDNLSAADALVQSSAEDREDSQLDVVDISEDQPADIFPEESNNGFNHAIVSSQSESESEESQNFQENLKKMGNQAKESINNKIEEIKSEVRRQHSRTISNILESSVKSNLNIRPEFKSETSIVKAVDDSPLLQTRKSAECSVRNRFAADTTTGTQLDSRGDQILPKSSTYTFGQGNSRDEKEAAGAALNNTDEIFNTSAQQVGSNPPNRKIMAGMEEMKNIGHQAAARFGSGLTMMGKAYAPSHITADFLKWEKSEQASFKPSSFRDLLCEPVLIGLFGTYSIYIQQSTVETIMTPTTDMLLGWKESENAYLLLGVGFECVIGFLSIGPISKRIKDRGVLLLGTGAISLITLIICLYAPYAAKELWWLMPAFVSSVAAFVFFMPYIVTGTAAVLSRAVPPERQATVQGLRTACERSGQILGPLLAAHCLNWNLIWTFLPPGLHVFLLYIMCTFSKNALSEEALTNYASGTHTRKRQHIKYLKRQNKDRSLVS